MKTLQIGLDWFPERAGGLQRYFYDLVLAAPAHQIDVRGVVVGSPNVVADSNGRVEAFGTMSDPLWSRLLGARRAINRVIKGCDPDVVASHFALYTLPTLDLIDRPLVLHFHGPWASEAEIERNSNLRQAIKTWVERTVYRRASLCITLSEAFATVLHESYRIPRERIRVIPGGVDVARFNVALSRLEARKALGWPTDRPIILSVRRLVSRMGLENLIEAMNEVVRRHPDALLIIGGQGPLASELAERIGARGLERNARLVGFIADDNLPLAYRAADFSVVPSLALEGFGLIAAESLAAGTPALVTPVGGLPEVVRSLSEALVLEGSLPGDFSTRIVDVISGAIKLPGPEACQSVARELFGWNTVMERVRLAYEEAIQSRI